TPPRRRRSCGRPAAEAGRTSARASTGSGPRPRRSAPASPSAGAAPGRDPGGAAPARSSRPSHAVVPGLGQARRRRPRYPGHVRLRLPTPRPESLLAWAAAAVGLIGVVSALTPEYADRFRIVHGILPPGIPTAARVGALAFGIALVWLSR